MGQILPGADPCARTRMRQALGEIIASMAFREEKLAIPPKIKHHPASPLLDAYAKELKTGTHCS